MSELQKTGSTGSAEPHFFAYKVAYKFVQFSGIFFISLNVQVRNNF